MNFPEKILYTIQHYPTPQKNSQTYFKDILTANKNRILLFKKQETFRSQVKRETLLQKLKIY